jgi:hypothetical protein
LAAEARTACRLEWCSLNRALLSVGNCRESRFFIMSSNVYSHLFGLFCDGMALGDEVDSALDPGYPTNEHVNEKSLVILSDLILVVVVGCSHIVCRGFGSFVDNAVLREILHLIIFRHALPIMQRVMTLTSKAAISLVR